MKVTSLKDVESYIYFSVIVHLKDLQLPEPIRVETPVFSDHGPVEFRLTREKLVGNFQHNFQRHRAKTDAKHLVIIRTGLTNQIAADYDPITKDVNIYPEAFNIGRGTKILLNKLVEAFNQNTPFRKVTMVPNILRESARMVEV